MINVEWKRTLEEGYGQLDIDTRELRVIKLEELREIKRKANEGWERSLKPARRKMTEEKKGGKSGDHTKDVDESKGRVGDPRFLAIMERVTQRECELLGIATPPSTTNVQVNVFDALAGQTEADPVEQRMKELLENRKRLALAMAGKDESSAGEVIEVVPEVNHCPLPGSMWPTLG